MCKLAHNINIDFLENVKKKAIFRETNQMAKHTGVQAECRNQMLRIFIQK